MPLVVVLALVLGGGSKTGTAPSPSPSGPSALAPISVPAPPSDSAAQAPCTALLAVLPVGLDGLASRPARSQSPYVVAWGNPAVVLRCGVPRPAVLTPGSTAFLPGINGVFYARTDGRKADVYTTVDRAVYVEITVPHTYAAGPLTTLSTAIAKALPPVCVVDPNERQADKLCTHRR